MSNKPIIGLIGGMGSGKSAVAAAFKRFGAKIISGDQLGHEALKQPEIKQQVIARWGTQLLDDKGEVQRSRLAAIVFDDPEQRRALESMVFPHIERRFQEEKAVAEANPDVRLIVLDAAIMLEAGWDQLCDRLVYVHAPRAERWRRLAEQRGWNAKEVEVREQAQLPLTEKARRAHGAIDNAGSIDALAAQVERLLRQWQLLAAPRET
ncbi:MAG: dephospho-CoA kinase [Gemmataceae bacterium]